MDALNFIQGMVAPAVMISACGLLLLGMNNKYSLVVNRIRLLNAELRTQDISQERKQSIHKQIPLLQRRMAMIKNAVWLYTLSVVFSVLTMIELAFRELTGKQLFLPIVSTFIIAVILVLAGSIYAAQETRLGYRIVSDIEIKCHLENY